MRITGETTLEVDTTLSQLKQEARDVLVLFKLKEFDQESVTESMSSLHEYLCKYDAPTCYNVVQRVDLSKPIRVTGNGYTVKYRKKPAPKPNSESDLANVHIG